VQSSSNSVVTIFGTLTLPNVLYCYINTLQTMSAVTNMVVFCSSMISCFSGILLRYFLNDYGMIPVAPVITGVTFAFTFCMQCTSLLKCFCLRIFSAYFMITRLSPEIATSSNICVRFYLSWIIMVVFFICCVDHIFENLDVLSHSRFFISSLLFY
jgi:hypothetical protein